MTAKKEKISELAGIIQEEFLRQCDLIECNDENLRGWIIYNIKSKLLEDMPTLFDTDSWMTGYDVIFEVLLDNEDPNYDISFLNENCDDVFKEAKRLIDMEIENINHKKYGTRRKSQSL